MGVRVLATTYTNGGLVKRYWVSGKPMVQECGAIGYLLVSSSAEKVVMHISSVVSRLKRVLLLRCVELKTHVD